MVAGGHADATGEVSKSGGTVRYTDGSAVVPEGAVGASESAKVIGRVSSVGAVVLAN